MGMSMVTVSPKGWVVIPAELRKKYDLRPGSRVVLVDYGGMLAIVPAMDHPVEESAGRLKSRRSMVKALLAERARERRREK